MGAYGYRRELAGQRRRAIVLGTASALGGIIGRCCCSTLPAGAFKAIVPALIVLALVLVVFGQRITAAVTRRPAPARASASAPLAVAGHRSAPACTAATSARRRACC